MNIGNVVEQTRRRLAVLAESRKRFAPQLAPQFSLFEFFRVDEMALSRCLAHLLDPNESHGQGTLFLTAFLDRLNIQYTEIDLEQTRIRIEQIIDEKRRIDLVVQFGDSIIGIENKPWASDQEEQLSAYVSWLEKQRKNWKLVYLCNEEPSEKSVTNKSREELETQKTLIRYEFHELADWIQETASLAKALTVRVFLEQLGQWIRKNVNGELDMSEKQEINALIDEDPNNLKAIVAISRAWPEMQRDLLESLRVQLNNLWNGPDVAWDERRLQNLSGSSYFSLARSEDQAFVVSFQFNSPRLDNLYWGISLREGRIPDQKQEIATMIRDKMQHRFGGDQRSDYYAWWAYAGDAELPLAYRNWSTNPQPWLDIKGGTMAKTITNLAKEAHQQLDSVPGVSNS